jgi:hypothetical protein
MELHPLSSPQISQDELTQNPQIPSQQLSHPLLLLGGLFIKENLSFGVFGVVFDSCIPVF